MQYANQTIILSFICAKQSYLNSKSIVLLEICIKLTLTKMSKFVEYLFTHLQAAKPDLLTPAPDGSRLPPVPPACLFGRYPVLVRFGLDRLAG